MIFFDVMMFGMDGFEICCCFKGFKVIKNIFIIFMIVFSDFIDKVKGFSLGVVDYVIKLF